MRPREPQPLLSIRRSRLWCAYFSCTVLTLPPASQAPLLAAWINWHDAGSAKRWLTTRPHRAPLPRAPLPAPAGCDFHGSERRTVTQPRFHLPPSAGFAQPVVCGGRHHRRAAVGGNVTFGGSYPPKRLPQTHLDSRPAATERAVRPIPLVYTLHSEAATCTSVVSSNIDRGHRHPV